MERNTSQRDSSRTTPFSVAFRFTGTGNETNLSCRSLPGFFFRSTDLRVNNKLLSSPYFILITTPVGIPMLIVAVNVLCSEIFLSHPYWRTLPNVPVLKNKWDALSIVKAHTDIHKKSLTSKTISVYPKWSDQPPLWDLLSKKSLKKPSPKKKKKPDKPSLKSPL